MNDSSRRPNKAAIVVMILFAAAIIGVIVYAVLGGKTSYTSWETTLSYGNIPDARYLRVKGGYIAYNSDGAGKYSGDGSVSWNISFSLEDPIAAANGDYAAFADRGGQTVHVTDGTGTNQSYTVSEKIAQICVADKGITAVRTNAGDSDRIYIYDINGNMLIDLKTDVKKSGFPITMALSGDGKKLVTSYLEVGQENTAWLTFYNFDDVGQNYSDKIVGSYSYEEELIVDIRFLNDSRVAVFYAGGCDVYKMREIPELVTNLRFDGGIEAVCGSDTGFAIARKETDGVSVVVYDLNGKAVSTINSSMSFDTMSLENDELILTQDDSCVIYRKGGDEKLRARFNDTICLMYPGSGNAEYVVVGRNTTERIRLRTLKEDAARAADEQ
ncbi:MAG: hypothetical protein J6Y89_08475 [Lachnospiraceae bacterium]|nr:hypothetical protein [Lachnospiraceae bacterium]